MEEDPTRQRRPLTGVTATALVIANMIGTGIFVTSGYLARDLKNAWSVLAVWALGGLLALCGASVYGELGAMLPRAGGEYVYLTRAFGPALGFLSGFVSLLVGFAAPIAASATAFALYAAELWPALRVDATAALLIALLSWVHLQDVRMGARVQTLLTLLKVALLVGFTGAGLVWGQGSFAWFVPPPELPSAESFASAVVLVSFAYSGWNAAAYVAGELEAPGRTLPRALLLGAGAVMVIYVGLNVCFFYAASPERLSKDPALVADTAARALFGARVGPILSCTIALALVSSVSAMIMTGPRVTLAMAEDGLFFAAFARRSADGSPRTGIVAQGLLAIGLVFTASFEAILTYIGFTLSLFAALTVAAALVLRWREPETPRPYRAFGWPATPLLFLGSSLWIVAFSLRAQPRSGASGLLTLLVGLLLYALWSNPPRRWPRHRA